MNSGNERDKTNKFDKFFKSKTHLENKSYEKTKKKEEEICIMYYNLL